MSRALVDPADPPSGDAVDERRRPGWAPSAFLVAAALGVAAYLANLADRLAGGVPSGTEASLRTALLVDALVGCGALALLLLRHRRPVVVACVTTVVLVVSAASFGPAVVAIYSLALRRRPLGIAAVAVAFLVSQVTGGLARLDPTAAEGRVDLDEIGFGLLVLSVPVAIGLYLSARRQLIVSLQDRARTAEREQALIGEAAREAERTRIAREMHDVLAHRISLVALHAGALTYREDLSRAETATTAATIQANAQLALAELRQVLGVLRAGPGTTDGPAAEVEVEPPQPTLAELPALLADAREAGTTVRLDAGPVEGSAMTTSLSRTAFRVVQEGLTNARKHAPDAPVAIRLSGSAGGDLEVELRNPVGSGSDAGPTGLGLVGLRERAELAGGSLVHGVQPDGTFLVRARLPWR